MHHHSDYLHRNTIISDGSTVLTNTSSSIAPCLTSLDNNNSAMLGLNNECYYVTDNWLSGYSNPLNPVKQMEGNVNGNENIFFSSNSIFGCYIECVLKVVQFFKKLLL